ncbi:hypothetical protein B0I37DRAFT_419274 [Chaetomium sp. MPI-CAGE-AT-0009]|nr:hypothetical protein B0I37DRAFT_419274 [Chaetomium sp. MPI-CAGE-AT-0009]
MFDMDIPSSGGSYSHKFDKAKIFPEGDFTNIIPNVVFDVHNNYYFAGRPTTSANLATYLCSDAAASAGDGKFPVSKRKAPC